MVIKRCQQYFTAFSILFLLAFSASAQEPKVREKSVRVGKGMNYDLPSEVVKAGAEVTLAVRKGERLLVSETIALPEALSGVITVSFLSNHEKELRVVRNMSKGRPELFRFTVSAGARVVVDVPFSEANRGSAALAEGGTVKGSSRMVQVNMPPPRQITVDGVYPDPECVEDCGDIYYECMNVLCDQRGDCSYCVQDYQWCEAQCPTICEEPKQVYEYGTSWQASGTTTDDFCWQNLYSYRLFTDWEERDIYERTVACNNTYTDVYKRTESRMESQCKWFLGLYCSGNQFYNVPDCTF